MHDSIDKRNIQANTQPASASVTAKKKTVRSSGKVPVPVMLKQASSEIPSVTAIDAILNSTVSVKKGQPQY